MKKYLAPYKPFLLFLGKFLLTYLVLAVVYQSYLNTFDTGQNKIDGFTKIVASQVEIVMRTFDCEVKTTLNQFEPAVNIYYRNIAIARVIEGCNGLSVIILFVSFVVAFTGSLKATVLFAIGGSILIYILNVLRIAAISVLLFYFPEREHLIHGVVFPLFIYGFVFLMWIIWVNKFSTYAKKVTATQN